MFVPSVRGAVRVVRVRELCVVTGRGAVRGAVSGASVTSRPETAECHEAETGGTQCETRDVEVHRWR